MRDLKSNIAVTQVLAPVVLASTNTSAALDTLGYGSATVVVSTGAIAGAGDYTAKLQHSHTTTSGDFEDVPAGDLLGTFPASLAENTVFAVGYIGPRRYLRTVVTKNSGTSIAASVNLVKGHPASAPVA